MDDGNSRFGGSVQVHKRGTPLNTAHMTKTSMLKTRARTGNPRTQFNTPEDILSRAKSMCNDSRLLIKVDIQDFARVFQNHIKQGDSSTTLDLGVDGSQHPNLLTVRDRNSNH